MEELEMPTSEKTDRPKTDYYWLAYFDWLGFKQQVKSSVEQNPVYSSQNICLSLDIFIEEFCDSFRKEAISRIQNHRTLSRESLEIRSVFFSDTLVLYVHGDDLPTFSVIELLSQELFLVFTSRGIPMRSALTHGLFYADNDKNIFIGPALIDAYEYAEGQDWIGFVLTPAAVKKLNALGRLPEDSFYIEYPIPYKGKNGKIVSKKLYCFRRLGNHGTNILAIQQMKDMAGTKHREKYQNTLDLIQFETQDRNKKGFS